MESDPFSRRKFLRTGAALAAGGAAAVALSPAVALAQRAPDPRAKLFETGRMVKVMIDLTPEQMETLRKKPREKVAAKVTDDANKVYREVSVHLRGGAGSFRPFDEKCGFTLIMDKWTDAQRFHGMKKFHLNNSVQDPSYLSELFCGELFRANGLPASRITHAWVLVNGKSKGLYVLKEGYDKVFLRNNFGDGEGNFYNGGFCSDMDQPLELLSGGADDMPPQEDLKAVVAAAREADPKVRFEKLEKLLDIEKFIAFVACEIVAWHWDGYAMKKNNYRIYQNVPPGKMVFIPSGMDQMWADPNGPIFPNFEGLLAKGLLETPEGRRRYLLRVAKITREQLNPTAMARWLDALQARVLPAVQFAEPQAARDYPAQVGRIRNAAGARTRNLGEQLRQVKF